jgi:hypothetical protein
VSEESTSIDHAYGSDREVSAHNDPLGALNRSKRIGLPDFLFGTSLCAVLFFALWGAGGHRTDMLVVALFILISVALITGSGKSEDDEEYLNPVLRSYQHRSSLFDSHMWRASGLLKQASAGGANTRVTAQSPMGDRQTSE